MYIKSMVIEGFKSYAQRTEINGFDPLFNAITGLNGSGKSNILDGICFLLGITNLSQVRATNLNELVYKNGQGGITKATVSITFDNSNKSQSPIGYQHMDEITVTRQIAIGNRNKYMINGSNANNTRAHDLFRSVHLNVNNPHFLIMQGRITKVLNMKPPEILSMIEEATGTRLYESKKEAAQKTIEKKEAKLREIDTVLKEEINPTIDRLKSERAAYLEYEKIRRELEHLNMQHVAYQFNQLEKLIHSNEESLKCMKSEIKNLENEIKDIEKAIKNNENLMTEIAKKRDEDAGGKLKELEIKLDECKKNYAKIQTTSKHQHEEIKLENKKLRDLDIQFKKDEKIIETSKLELERLTEGLAKLETESKKNEADYEDAQSNLKAVKSGMMRDEHGKESSLNEQLIAVKNEIAKAEIDIKRATSRLKHNRDELKRKQNEVQNTDNNYKKEQTSFEKLTADLKKLENDLQRLDYVDGTEENFIHQRKQVDQNLQCLRDMTENLESRYPQLQFEYKDPERNFNRNSVHGLVANLISIQDPKYATAIEVVAGGKLYQVVVDTEQTGKKLLQNGELKRRVTIIPLNKIAGKSIPQDVVRRAEQIVGHDGVHTALSLVGFDNKLVAAMEYIFGTCFVCYDLDMAKKVAFDDRVNRKTVTLDGDSFDPAGLLTGGSRPQMSSILLKLNEIKSSKDDLNAARRELQQLDQNLIKIKNIAARWREMKQNFDLKNQELQAVSDRMKQSNHGQHLADIDSLKQDIVAMETLLISSQELLEKSTKKQKTIEDRINNSGAMRDNDIKNAEGVLEKAKKLADQTNREVREKLQELDVMRLEVVEFEKERENMLVQIIASKQHIVDLESKLRIHDSEAEISRQKLEELQEAVNTQKDLLKEANKEIHERQQEIQRLTQSINNKNLEIQEMKHKIDNEVESVTESTKTIQRLLRIHSWIEEQRASFGQPNTPYDFSIYDVANIDRRCKTLEATKEKLSKNVNERAMNMLGKAEEQHDEMVKKRKIVVKDKEKISALIEELDEKKKGALTVAYQQVTKDFGSIFSTLLPGASAKLTAPHGKTILDGLEFRVGFGGAWKESLSELSGGQRSLVALSLILALLRFNPAPLYILDEVDAALDISHTQNIGHMLRTHFQNSQFIVVSLKDGMFNNANVLFKTKFVDGVSMVTRHTQARGNLLNSNSHITTDKSKSKSNKRINEELIL